MKESRYETAIFLALLKRSNGYARLGFQSAEHLAAEKGRLEPRDWSQMLSVGGRALDYPEIDVAFRDGRLNWSKIRAMIPHADRENVEELIELAARLTSNQFEREISRRRDPSVGGPPHADPPARGLRAAHGIHEWSRRGSDERTQRPKSALALLATVAWGKAGSCELRCAATLPQCSRAPVSAPPAPDVPAEPSLPADIRWHALIRSRFQCALQEPLVPRGPPLIPSARAGRTRSITSW